MTIEGKKALVRRMVEEAWNGHWPERVDNYFGCDLLAEGAGHVQQFITAFQYVHITTEDLIAE